MWKFLTVAMVIGASGIVPVGARQSGRYSGSADYQVYCSSCHGAGGRGDGVIAKSLKQKPVDLTLLSQRNDGVFPEKRVFTSIDARQVGGAHGDTVMPEWRGVFAKSSESLGEERAVARINALVTYLQTLQVK